MKDLTETEKNLARELAERSVSIPKGGRVGRWTREDRVSLVYSVICSLVRLGKNKKK